MVDFIKIHILRKKQCLEQQYVVYFVWLGYPLRYPSLSLSLFLYPQPVIWKAE